MEDHFLWNFLGKDVSYRLTNDLNRAAKAAAKMKYFSRLDTEALIELLKYSSLESFSKIDCHVSPRNFL